LPLTREAPKFAPITEDHPLVPETGYALAKVLCERMAREMARWNPGTSFAGLRISNIFEPPDYAGIPSFWDDPTLRRWNLWSWVDARDVAGLPPRAGRGHPGRRPFHHRCGRHADARAERHADGESFPGRAGQIRHRRA
jgi:nucleoside-diphosphate-sugar epimerase